MINENKSQLLSFAESKTAAIYNACDIVLAHWSRTQAPVSISSCEAELYAISEGLCEVLGLMSILKCMSWDVKATLYSDSTAAISACRRSGTGSRLRHVDIRHFHIQEVLRRGDIELDKVAGELNPADIGTKAVSATTLRRLMPMAGLRRFATGAVTGENLIEDIAAVSENATGRR